MTAPEPVTCRRGHERNETTSKFRTIVRNGKVIEFWDCRECRKIAARKRRVRAQMDSAE